jgi:hypothetical protein
MNCRTFNHLKSKDLHVERDWKKKELGGEEGLPLKGLLVAILFFQISKLEQERPKSSTASPGVLGCSGTGKLDLDRETVDAVSPPLAGRPSN